VYRGMATLTFNNMSGIGIGRRQGGRGAEDGAHDADHAPVG